MSTEEYQAAISVPAVRRDSERRGRDLSPAELRGLFDACTRAPRDGPGHDSAVRRRRDAAFLALAYGCGFRRSEAVALDVADLDLVGGELRVRRGKGKKPRQVSLPPSTVPGLQDWRRVCGPEPGSLFCAVLKSGRLVRAGAGPAGLSPGAAWRICKERGRKGQIQAPAPHDLRRTWIGDLLDLGVDLATVQKMAEHASASTTAGYDRRDRGVQRRAAVLLQVPYTVPED